MAAASVREREELRLSAILEKFFREQMERLLVNADKMQEDMALYYVLHPVLLRIAEKEARRLMQELQSKRLFEELWDKVWARVSVEVWTLVRGINQTTFDHLGQALLTFTQGGQTMGELREVIAGIFTPERAQAIAVTELTRAYATATQIDAEELKAAGLDVREIWHTDNDDLVCDECGPLNGTQRGEDWEDYPPLHPNCRCSVDVEFNR